VARRATKTVRLDGIEEAAAVVAALKNVDKDTRTAVNKQTRSVVSPVWQDEVMGRVSTPMDKTVLGTGVRVATAALGFTLHGANNKKTLSGGLVPVESWKAWEFGANRNTATTYQGRRRGKNFKVKRHTKRQLPARNQSGRVLFPAVADVFPRVASLWTQTAMYNLYQAFKSL
jgi:hypothetical protein